MRDALAEMRDLLLPPRCAGCGAPGSWFCHPCRDLCEPDDVPLAAGPRARAAGVFAGPLRDALHRFKYRAEPALAAELGDLVAGVIAGDLARGGVLDAIVPVPLHRRRAAERGYDQAALLAASVAERCGLPVLAPLRRVRWSRPQVELDRAERSINVAGAFVGVAGSLAGLSVALIDDVATTGSTLGACASAARACGARVVRSYVVAVDA